MTARELIKALQDLGEDNLGLNVFSTNIDLATGRTYCLIDEVKIVDECDDKFINLNWG